MYIFYSILAMLCFGFMMFLDHVLLNKASLKFTLVFKSVLFMLFALIFIATKQSFDKLLDFVDLEWLFLVLFAVFSVVIVLLYNLSVKEIKPHKFALFNVSTLLIFINIYFLIFSIDSIMNKSSVLSIILVVVELVLLLGVVITLFFFDKENKKVNMIFTMVSTSAFAGLVILKSVKIKNQLMIRQPLEVFIFWMAVTCLVASILFALFYKRNKEKLTTKQKRENKIPWQHYIVAFLPSACAIMTFVFSYGGLNNDANANIHVINLIVGLGFIVPVILEIINGFKNKLKISEIIKNNGVLLINSIALITALSLYLLA